jgi:hypothetical protein
MAVTASSAGMDSSPSSASLHGLDGINFFLAGMQSGFGPFVAVLLADEKWTQQDIGFVLTVGGLVGLLSQVPGGELLDASRSKRFLAPSHARDFNRDGSMDRPWRSAALELDLGRIRIGHELGTPAQVPR